MRTHIWRPTLLLAPFLLFVMPGAAAAAADSCQGEAYARLDFWLGNWEVHGPDGEHAGSNRIEPTLSGCALLEHWTGSGGGEGKSLFYYYAPERRWKQVWVTEAGFVKEKAELLDYEGPGVRFQGTVVYPEATVLDRTTLTPGEDGSVRQVIEVSTDGGDTWRVGFDGLYRRPEASG